MKGELKTFLVFVALPAIALTATGFSMLVFSSGGFASELKSASLEEQIERYERNVKDRMARKLHAYRRNGRCDYQWEEAQVPWGTNVSKRIKYGCFTGHDGKTVGWARVGDGKVIGYDVESFKAEEPFRLWAFGAGASVLLMLFLVLSFKGFKLALAAKRAREELEMKNSFLDVVSHELNTPLASIVPLASALARGSIKDAGRIAHAQETISREASRMARMIGSLLDAVRLRNGKLMFKREMFDLSEVSLNAAEMVRSYHSSHRIEVVPASGIMATGDADKAIQIIVNFLDNACKYGGDGEIKVECRSSCGRAEVSVFDRGPGIPEDELRSVFKKFYRVDGAHGGGLGLGLNVAEALASGMGGRVFAANRKDGGCVFTLTLDLAEQTGDGDRKNG